MGVSRERNSRRVREGARLAFVTGGAVRMAAPLV